MKIALIGYGKMGRQIEEVALQKGHEIVARIVRQSPEKKLIAETLHEAEVCIDFSHPDCILDNIKQVARCRKNLVVGTTGWYDHLDSIKGIVSDSKIGFLYSPNFSLGVHLFLNIVAEAATLIDKFEDYDVGVIEAHHNKKADSPSGTAKTIADILLSRIKRKKCLSCNTAEGQMDPHALQIASVRCGNIPGTHTVQFDGPVDTITLMHQARSREGFARGAVSGAEWLNKKSGFYTLEDMLGM